MIRVFEVGGNHQKALRVGVALELDAHAAPHRTPGAVGADQVVTLQAQGLALLLRHQMHLVGRLADRLDLGAEQDLDMRQQGQLVLDRLGQLPLLALQPKRMLGVVLEQVHVEFGDHAFGAVALLGVARHQSLRHDGLRQAVARQHVERWRVKGRSTQIHAQAGGPLQQGHGDASSPQNQGTDHAHRSGAGDQDV